MSAISTIARTEARTDASRPAGTGGPIAAGPPASWTCPNCSRETAAGRKRCRECGTSRF